MSNYFLFFFRKGTCCPDAELDGSALCRCVDARKKKRNSADHLLINSSVPYYIYYSYLGRKRLKHENETWVEGSQLLVNVEYSYWTLSYILSKRGAEKLLKGQPFGQLVPVDEYLPIMFDRHPESRWREAFPNRNLKVLMR